MALDTDAAMTGCAGDLPGGRAVDDPRGPGLAPSGSFPLAAYLTRWAACTHHDLAASDAQTLPLAALLRLASPEDLQRWRTVKLGYADPRGASWLRAAVAARYAGLAQDDVLLSAGVQEAVACVLRALLAPDDHAVAVVPIYQPSEMAVTGLCAASGVPLDPDRG